MIYSHFAAFEASEGVVQLSGSTTVSYNSLQIVDFRLQTTVPGNCGKYLPQDQAELRYLQGISKLIPAALEVARRVNGPSLHHNDPKSVYFRITAWKHPPLHSSIPKNLISMQHPTIGQIISGATSTFRMMT